MDEIQEENGENLYSAILSYEEQGIHKAVMGSKSISIKAISPLVYISNPAEMGTNTPDTIAGITTKMMHSFDVFLKKVTTNYRAFGRRKGVILFSDKVNTAQRRGKGTDEEKYKDLWEFALKKLRPKFTEKLMDEQVQAWLNEPFPESYLREIDKVRNELPPEIKAFWNGYKDAFRHTRGTALRLALLDYVDEFYNDLSIVDTDDLLNCADAYFHDIMDINIKSLEEMSKVPISMDIYGDYVKFKAKWLEVLMLSLARHYEDMTQEQKSSFLGGILEVDLDDLNENSKIYGQDTRYGQGISLVTQKINNSWEGKMGNFYGIRVNLQNQTVACVDNEKWTFTFRLISHYPNYPITQISEVGRGGKASGGEE